MHSCIALWKLSKIEHALDIIAAYFNTFATPMLEGKQVDTSSFHGNILDWRLKGTIV